MTNSTDDAPKGELLLYQSELSSKGPTYTVLERFSLDNA